MNKMVSRRVATVMCAICAMAVVAGCPQTQLLSSLFFDVDPAPLAALPATTTALNTPPTIDAGGDIAVSAGNDVFLDGTATFDADGDRMLFWWLQTAGEPRVELSNGFASVANFRAPQVNTTTTLTFRLTVIDGTVAVTQDVDVVVQPN